MSLLVATIDGVDYDLPTPSPGNYKFQNTHLENSYISANGYLNRDIVRRNRSKIFCGWDLLKEDDMSLLERIYDKDYIYLTCTDNHNSRVKKKVYAGPLDGSAAFMNKDDFTIKFRTEVQMNFIEY